MSAADWGLTFETHVCDRLDLDHVAHQGGGHENVDAISTRAVRARSAGEAVRPTLFFADAVRPEETIACKVARYRISDGETSRRGRYWIPRDELDAVDAYALGVYTKGAGVLEDAVTIVPSDYVYDLVSSWVDSPCADFEQVVRPPWSKVFDPTEVSP